MLTRLASRLRREDGIAALTVVMVTSVLAVSGAVVVFSATAELEIGSRERRAEDAFSAAEAGLDLAAARLFSRPTFSSGETQVCLNNPLVPASAGIACEVRITSPAHAGRFFVPTSGPPYIDYRVVSRAKEGRSVVRTLGASYRVSPRKVPFGLFVNGNVDLNGTPKLLRESLLVNGRVLSREQLSTDWNGNRQLDDPDLGWAFHRDQISSNPDPSLCTDTSSGQQVGCAGVFSNFQIYSKNQEKATDEIHLNTSNPADPSLSAFRNDRDVHQTRVINGVPTPVVTLPTSDVLGVMEPLKRLAESQNLYINHKNGSNNTIQIQPSTLGAPAAEFSRDVVVYIDADAGDTIAWNVNLVPASTASDMRYTNEAGQRIGPDSGIIVVRGGSLRMEANTQWSGALFVPENSFRILGGAVCTCTVYANGFTAEGGTSTMQLTPEWFLRMPGGLVTVTRTAFAECEPFQAAPGSQVCPTT